ncbi:MAG: hypothetical protein JWN15_661 [Firmicutes bacterium]|nr:hypothetical protein [Bacillota bacterium]
MQFGYPATVFGGGFAAIPASVFEVVPGGVPVPVGIFPFPPTFPFGVPYTAVGGTFFAIPAAAVGIAPVI